MLCGSLRGTTQDLLSTGRTVELVRNSHSASLWDWLTGLYAT
jgi:hypothetical protein